MPIRTINGFSLFIAVIIALVTAIPPVTDAVSGEHVSLIGWVLPALCATIAFLTVRVFIRRFFIYRLKPIYQIALSKDISSREMREDFLGAPNIAEKVRKELTEISERNRQKIMQLRQMEDYRKEYIGNVAHELKTPIFNVHGYISTLLDGGMEDPVISHRYLQSAEKNIERLVNIVNDLDKITKLESGVLSMRQEDFDIVDLTRQIVETTEFEATKRHIRILLDAQGVSSPRDTRVRADKSYIEQVLVNLIINSIHYGIEGGMTTVTFSDLFDKILIEVSDNGIGIAAEDIPHIFERFFRTDKSRSREQGGTGLGLSIVKHIIEAHNESITVRSELGKGSTFSFTLSKI